MGGFEARLDGHSLHGFESDKVRALLVYLVVEGERAHRRERVATLLWPDQPPEVALHRLRQALANLRTVLGDATAAIPALLISRAELRLNPDRPVWVDAVAVEEEVGWCRQHQHLRPQACRACLRRLARAVELCAGPFLDGFTVEESDVFEEWVAVRRRYVEAQVVPALAQLAGHAQRERDYARAARYAERRLAFEPWCEEAHRTVMHALAHTDQRTAALRQYQLCRAALLDELGIEPSAETQRLAREIERGGRPAVVPDPPHNVPAQLTRLVGRERELAEVAELLATQRLVSLVGPGGCGKTRLAIEVAWAMRRDYRDGVWLVELAPVSDPSRVAQAVTRALTASERPGQSQAESVADHLRGKEALLILDNCEHVIGACAALVDQLLRACPALSILTTSREALRVTGEHVRHVLPLPVEALEPDTVARERLFEAVSSSSAAALFLERANAVSPGLALTLESAPDVASICHALDGIPLALELAATWAGTFTLAQLRAGLDDRFRLLDRGSRTADARHQTLEALIGWSYDLLTPSERAVYLRLSVFAGGGPLDGALAVCRDVGGAHLVERAMRGLAAKSIVRIETGAGGERFRLLETLREYARPRLEAGDAAPAAKAAHARFFLEFAEEHATAYKWAGRVEAASLGSLDAERDNLELALAHFRRAGDAEAEMHLASALAWYWYNAGQLATGAERLEHALAGGAGGETHSAPAVRRERANALLAAGYIARLKADARAGRYLEEALALCRALGEAAGTAGAARGLAYLRENFDAAQSLLGEALAIYQAAGDEERSTWVTFELGWLASLYGRPEQAEPLLADALTRFAERRDARGAMYAGLVLGEALLALGNHGGAQKEIAQALALMVGTRDRIFAPYLLETCAWLCVEAGAAEQALTVLGAASAIRERNAHQPIAQQAERVRRLDSRARAALAADEAMAAWRRGQAMTLEEALGAALPAVPPFGHT